MKKSLADDRKRLLGRYEFVDIALKVVGVGSVGTRAFMVLMIGKGDKDPLFLQFKEAQASVLEPYAGASEYSHHGERVVCGQRLSQAASDIFLGWVNSPRDKNIHYYFRQLRDMKGSFEVEGGTPEGFVLYAQACGATLARAHARGRTAERLAPPGSAYYHALPRAPAAPRSSEGGKRCALYLTQQRRRTGSPRARESTACSGTSLSSSSGTRTGRRAR